MKQELVIYNRVKNQVPFTPAMRHTGFIDRYNLYKKGTFKYFKKGILNCSGHNNTGRITVFSKANRHKRSFRFLDFKRRTAAGVPLVVKRLEYDPNRSSFIALLLSSNGIFSYILAPHGLEVGQAILFFKKKPLFFLHGHCAFLGDMPFGTTLYGIEKLPKQGAILTRSAGTFSILLKKENNRCVVRLGSGIVLFLSTFCMASVGTVSNKNYKFRVIGKAGRNRWLGKKPIVRGVAMNPVDHPHGGGEGKKSGRRCPLSPWGKPTKWKKTKKNKR